MNAFYALFMFSFNLTPIRLVIECAYRTDMSTMRILDFVRKSWRKTIKLRDTHAVLTFYWYYVVLLFLKVRKTNLYFNFKYIYVRGVCKGHRRSACIIRLNTLIIYYILHLVDLCTPLSPTYYLALITILHTRMY